MYGGYRPSVLAESVDQALDRSPTNSTSGFGLGAVEPADERDALRTLLLLYDLWTAPLPTLGPRAAWQGHPEVAEVKWRLEHWLESDLDAMVVAEEVPARLDGRAVAASMRALAHRDRTPAVYEWLADEATWTELVRFLAVEGGPDGGFDDLVSQCQIGLAGGPKVVLADNYWDEMGRGSVDDVHTVLHDRLVEAIDMPRIGRADLPLPALRRGALNGLLATHRRLQPEMLGALGLLELQAGPRCRLVVRALRRLGAPAGSLPFYEVHAQIDPRHGKEWLDGAIVPLVNDHPEWSEGVLRGARWRSAVNRELFDTLFENRHVNERAA